MEEDDNLYRGLQLTFINMSRNQTLIQLLGFTGMDRTDVVLQSA